MTDTDIEEAVARVANAALPRLTCLVTQKPCTDTVDICHACSCVRCAHWAHRQETIRTTIAAHAAALSANGRVIVPRETLDAGWKEATIAWAVCGSIHREYAKGRDPFYTTRHGDFVKHEKDSRAMIAAAETENNDG